MDSVQPLNDENNMEGTQTGGYEIRSLHDMNPDFALDQNLYMLAEAGKPDIKEYYDRRVAIAPQDGMDVEIRHHIDSLYSSEIPLEITEELVREGKFWKEHSGNPEEIKQKIDEVKKLQDLYYLDNRKFLEGMQLYGKAYNDKLMGDWLVEASLTSFSKEDLTRQLAGIGIVSLDLNGLNALNKNGKGRENTMGDEGLRITADLLQNSKAVAWLKQQGGELPIQNDLKDEESGEVKEDQTIVSAAGIGGDEFALYFKIAPDHNLTPEQQQEKNQQILTMFREKFMAEISSQEVDEFIDYDKQDVQTLKETAAKLCEENGIPSDNFKFRLSTSIGIATALDTVKAVPVVSNPWDHREYVKAVVGETAKRSDESAMAFKEKFKADLAKTDPFLWLLYAKGDPDSLVKQIEEFRGDVDGLREELKRINPELTDDALDMLVGSNLQEAIGSSPTYVDAPEVDAEGVTIEDKIQQVQNLPGFERKKGPQSHFYLMEQVNEMLYGMPSSVRAPIDADIAFCRKKGLEDRQILARVRRKQSMLEQAFKDSRPAIDEMYNGEYSRAMLQDHIRGLFERGDASPENLEKIIRTTMNLTGMKIVNDTGDHSKGDEALGKGAYALNLYARHLWFEHGEELRADATSERGDRFGCLFDVTKMKDAPPYNVIVFKLEQELRQQVERMNAVRLLDWNHPKVKELADVLGITVDPTVPFHLSMIPGSTSLKHAIAHMDISQYKTFDEFVTAASGVMFEQADRNMETLKYKILKPALRDADPQKYLSVARNKMDILENERARYIRQKEIFQQRLEEERLKAAEKAAAQPAVLRRKK